MEKFLALSQEKQNKIIEAAMKVFGEAGYKKAYISEIAAKAGISKAMVFYYFGSKKTLYLYLIEYARRIIISEMQEKRDCSNTDFFERIIEAARLKLSMMSRYHALYGFLASIYCEEDPDVVPEIKETFSKGEEIRSEIVLNGADERKFKDGVDPNLVMNIIVKFTEGVVGSRLDNTSNMDEIMEEFTQSLVLLKNNLYKEEFLR